MKLKQFFKNKIVKGKMLKKDKTIIPLVFIYFSISSKDSKIILIINYHPSFAMRLPKLSMNKKTNFYIRKSDITL